MPNPKSALGTTGLVNRLATFVRADKLQISTLVCQSVALAGEHWPLLFEADVEGREGGEVEYGVSASCIIGGSTS